MDGFLCQLSEGRSHLGEYAANRGLSRMTQMARIFGGSTITWTSTEW